MVGRPLVERGHPLVGQALAQPARRGVGRDGGAARRGGARRLEAAAATGAAADAGRYGLSDSYVRDLRRRRLSRPAPRAASSSRRATTSARSTSCRSTTRSSATSTEIRGDMRDPARARELCDGADVLVHAAAALPIRGSRREIMSVNVDGTATLLAAARDAGVRPRRLHLVDRRLRRAEGASALRGRPARRRRPVRRVEDRVRAARRARRRSRPSIIRPKTFLGPERLGVFEILFDWIRDGRRIYVLGDGDEPLPAARRRGSRRRRSPARATADVAGEVFNVGATEFGTVRSDLEALIAHAGTASRLRPVPARPAELALRALELARLSPLGEWHYKTASRDSFVDVSKAERLLGWQRDEVQRRDARRELRLVRGEPRADAGGRRHAPRPVEPAGARPG